MKKILGFITICGLLVGCSHQESKDIIQQEHRPKLIGEVLAKGNEWEESEYFTSENISLIGEPQLLGFTNRKEERVKGTH